eukprot:symbB.v1.2.004004.t1/scaffold225.1/size261367/5
MARPCTPTQGTFRHVSLYRNLSLLVDQPCQTLLQGFRLKDPETMTQIRPTETVAQSMENVANIVESTGNTPKSDFHKTPSDEMGPAPQVSQFCGNSVSKTLPF